MQRQRDIESALAELTELLAEADEANRERENTDLSIEAFLVYWTLREAEVDGAQEVGRSADSAFREYLHWRQSSDHEREIRRVLHKELVPRMGVERSTETVCRVLDTLRRAGV